MLEFYICCSIRFSKKFVIVKYSRKKYTEEKQKHFFFLNWPMTFRLIRTVTATCVMFWRCELIHAGSNNKLETKSRLLFSHYSSLFMRQQLQQLDFREQRDSLKSSLHAIFSLFFDSQSLGSVPAPNPNHPPMCVLSVCGGVRGDGERGGPGAEACSGWRGCQLINLHSFPDVALHRVTV